MKTRFLIYIILWVVLVTVSTGCENLSSLPTAMPIPSNTALATSTMNPTSTSTPTPIVEKDLQPAYTETITQVYMDVEINLSIITDKSMDSYNPSIDRIYVNPHFNNYKGENSKVALAHFAAFTFYRAWQFHQSPGQPTSDTDFKSYLQLWSQAQKTNDPADWEKVQINGVWANDLNDGNGYKQQSYIIWPMYTGDLAKVPQEVRAIAEIDVAIGRFSKMKNITSLSENSFGFGTNLDGNKLYVYSGEGVNGNVDYTGGWDSTYSLIYSMMWLIKNQGGSNFPAQGTDRELYVIINLHTNPGDCCYRAALKIDPPTRSEKIYNP